MMYLLMKVKGNDQKERENGSLTSPVNQMVISDHLPLQVVFVFVIVNCTINYRLRWQT